MTKKARAKAIPMFVNDPSAFLSFLQDVLFEVQYKTLRLLHHRRVPSQFEIRQTLLPAYEALATLIFKDETEGTASELFKLVIEHKVHTGAFLISFEHRKDEVAQVYNLRFEPMQGDKFLHIRASRRTKVDDPIAEAAKIYEQL